MTATNSNRHPLAVTRLKRPTLRPPVAASYMPLAGNHSSNNAAAHADRVTCAGRNGRNGYQAGSSRPAP